MEGDENWHASMPAGANGVIMRRRHSSHYSSNAAQARQNGRSDVRTYRPSVLRSRERGRLLPEVWNTGE